MRILGIDPGSRVTGYGVLEWRDGAPRHVDNGVLVLPEKLALPERLALLYRGVRELVERFNPQTAAVESVFTAKNIRSAIVLAQARGAILAVFGERRLPVHEYAPAAVKTAVTGYGRAEKAQMQKMVRVLLALPEDAATDASDALAVGICHLRTVRVAALVPAALAGGRL